MPRGSRPYAAEVGRMTLIAHEPPTLESSSARGRKGGTMADTDPTRTSRRSLVGVAVAVLGLVLVAYGITGLIFGSAEFETDPGGTVAGDSWLGIEGNGWTNALFVAAGVLLILGSPAPLGSVMALVLAGLMLGAAAIIALIDGDDVFGVFAADGWTMLAWGVAALVLLAAAALHVIRWRSGGRKAGVPRHDSERSHSDEALERELFGTPRAKR
jgi:hypothetical protein